MRLVIHFSIYHFIVVFIFGLITKIKEPESLIFSFLLCLS
jgi:hypothetical protein